MDGTGAKEERPLRTTNLALKPVNHESCMFSSSHTYKSSGQLWAYVMSLIQYSKIREYWFEFVFTSDIALEATGKKKERMSCWRCGVCSYVVHFVIFISIFNPFFYFFHCKVWKYIIIYSLYNCKIFFH